MIRHSALTVDATPSHLPRTSFISGGTNIYPREVEEVLLRHAAVTEDSVIGRADPEWGESAVACVVVDDACVSAQELDDFIRQHMTGFKLSKQYHFLQSLPKNNNGKVLKTHLRTTHAAPTTTQATPEAAKPLLPREDRT